MGDHNTPAETRLENARLRAELADLRAQIQLLQTSRTAPAPAPHDATAEALRQSEQRLSQFYQQCPFAVIEWDRDFRVSEWNAAAERTFGYRRDEIMGEHARVIVPRKLWPLIDQVWRDLIGHKGGGRSRNENIRADGSTILCEWYNGQRLDENGDVVAVISLADDVTAQVRAEEERRQLERRMLEAAKLESLGVLAGGIAHDFNNLLVGILGSASLALLDMSADDPARRHVELIDRTGQRAAELTRQMLAYSGKGRFVVEAASLSRLVEEMAPLLAASVSKSTEFIYELDPKLPTIDADVTQIRQVVMNLILNAADALESGRGRVRVTTGILSRRPHVVVQMHEAPAPRPGRYVYVQVMDNGGGMDEDTQARIFDPFFTTKQKGHGLGLAAVIGIVRGHRGFISVDSEPGAGTTFVVGLPIGPERTSRRMPPTARNTRVATASTVLVIDDEPAVRDVVAEMLQAEGCQSLTAASGAAGLLLLIENEADVQLVLLDLNMPRLSGDEIYARIAKIAPQLPVVLMSGHAESQVIERFADAPIAGFIQKPFGATALSSVLRRMLSRPDQPA